MGLREGSAAPRIAAIDVARGAVMVLMAIDHVRVYAGVPAGGPEFGVFFTRWVTHFCAPAFVFLAGTSAFLHGRRHGGLPAFLLSRGVWLVVLELTVLRLAWTFNADFAGYNMAGVIWAIGWCMILLAPLTKLPPAATGVFGVAVLAGHNLLDPVFGNIVEGAGDGLHGAAWRILYLGFWAGPVSAGPEGPGLIVLYSIVPWIGVMAAGYGFGAVLLHEPARRDRACLAIGVGATALFLLLRGFNLYGDPSPWSAPAEGDPAALPAAFSFLNTTKYPASLLFLLMTLGPTIALLPLLERLRGVVGRTLEVFGRVPFFFYVLHIPLAHALAFVVSLAATGEVSWWLFANHPMGAPPAPEGYRWGLGTLYLVWATVIPLLYPACVWFAGLKSRRREWWLRYL